MIPALLSSLPPALRPPPSISRCCSRLGLLADRLLLNAYCICQGPLQLKGPLQTSKTAVVVLGVVLGVVLVVLMFHTYGSSGLPQRLRFPRIADLAPALPHGWWHRNVIRTSPLTCYPLQYQKSPFIPSVKHKLRREQLLLSSFLFLSLPFSSFLFSSLLLPSPPLSFPLSPRFC
jgi:hypothetical protein